MNSQIRKDFLTSVCREPAKLEIRIENLARAITNAKSAMDQHQLSNQVDGELLHDLEEKMEVARIQLKIYNDLQQIADLKLRDQARAELDTQLYTVSEVCPILSVSL
jgi:hypothetical protein